MNFSLFEEPSSFDRTGLARRLRELASENIWIGTSSWKYEGWLDQIYTTERYLTRGKLSKARFEAECLAVQEVAISRPTLDEVFLKHTGRAMKIEEVRPMSRMPFGGRRRMN